MQPIEHEIKLRLESGAGLKLIYFSDREVRWIFHYHYGSDGPGRNLVINDVGLVADYADGALAPTFKLTMLVVVPRRLDQVSFLGVDISPGAKTYFEFAYERVDAEYRLTEIVRGMHARIRVDQLGDALVKPIDFPFPVPDRVPADLVRVPFLRSDGHVSYFDLPAQTLRRGTRSNRTYEPDQIEEGQVPGARALRAHDELRDGAHQGRVHRRARRDRR